MNINVKSLVKNNIHLWRLIGIMIVWMIFMAMTVFGKFYSFNNFKTMASQFPEYGLMALGVMLCMMSGGIDLSCVGVANLTSIFAASLMISMVGENGALPVAMYPVIFLFAIAIGAVCGAVNGFLVSKVRIPPILATLGMNELLTGISTAFTSGNAVSSFPKEMTTLISSDLGGVLPVRLIFFIVIFVIIWFMLTHTTYGTKLRLLGTSEKVASYSGLNTDMILIRTYITSGICAALGGMMMLATYASARADYGSQYTLQTVLIVVLGGISPNGGKGKISGVLAAIILLKMLEAGINRFPSVSSYYISLIWGSVLILAMMAEVSPNFFKKKASKKS